MLDLKRMVLDLAAAGGTPGNEGVVLKKIEEYISPFCDTCTDRFGNLVGKAPGNGRTVLLEAHADRIGLMVTSVEDGGFLRVVKCGGADARVLTAQGVTVWGRRPVCGVVTSVPPYPNWKGSSSKAPDFEELLVDTGMSRSEAEKLISPGDRITFISRGAELLNGRVLSPALDDRAGCAVIILAASLILQREDHPSLTLLFSGQEETGGSGAVTGAFNIDADECISVDVSFAAAPGVPAEKCGELGKGPMIGFSPVLDYDMSSRLVAAAEREGIPYRTEIMGAGTGTDADHIAVSRGGVKTALISVPQRNMHTAVEIVSLDDIENRAKLIAAYVNGGGDDA